MVKIEKFNSSPLNDFPIIFIKIIYLSAKINNFSFMKQAALYSLQRMIYHESSYRNDYNVYSYGNELRF